MNDALEHYECDDQIDIEEWLWSIGYYMQLPANEEIEKDC